jgi:ankyrin repeat protein
VELLLGLGADREAFLGETSLFEAACEGGCAGLVKQLLAEAAVDPEELPQDSLDICLSAAAGRGRAEVVELLLDAGARVDSMAMGKAAVISALQRGHVDAAKALLAAGARVHERGLMCAAMGGAVELVTLMLARGADVNLQEGLGQTALSYASEPAVVRALLAAKADVNPDQGLSVLTGSCVELNLESINILLDAKAGVDGSAPRTPLQVALESSRRRERPEALVAVVEALLGAGARVTGLGKGATALQVLAGLDPTPATGRVAQLLVAAGPEAVDAVDGAGVSVLAVAVARENGPLVDELLRARADVNLCRDRHQRTLLMEVRPTRLRQVRALLQAGADVNARCETGRTPLFYAVSVQVHARQWPFHRECARLLLVAGADPALEDQQGATALMAALSRKNRVTDADIVGLIHDIVELAYSMHRPNHRSRGNSKGI